MAPSVEMHSHSRSKVFPLSWQRSATAAGKLCDDGSNGVAAQWECFPATAGELPHGSGDAAGQGVIPRTGVCRQR